MKVTKEDYMEMSAVTYGDAAIDRGHVIGEDVWFSVSQIEEAFLTGYNTGLDSPEVQKLVTALEKNKSEWEAVSPDGYKHLVAWQAARDALREFKGEKK